MGQQPFYKCITYNLKLDGSFLEQPYVDMKNIGEIYFDGGIVIKDGVYLGVVYTTQGKMQSFINQHKQKYNVVELTDQEGIDFFTNTVHDYIDPATGKLITIQMQVDNFKEKLK